MNIQEIEQSILSGHAGHALSAVDKLLAKQPDDMRCLLLRADSLKALKRDLDAALAFVRAAQQGGKYAFLAWLRAGQQYQKLSMHAESCSALQKSYAANPNHAETMNTLCGELYTYNLHNVALPFAKRLVREKMEGANFMLAGHILRACAVFDLARDAYTLAYEHAAEKSYAISSKLHSEMLLCSWDEVARLQALIYENWYDKGLFKELVQSPLVNVSWCMDEHINCETAKGFAAQSLGAIAKVYTHENHHWGTRLKIGYVSRDFYNHAVLHLLCGVFEQHDKNSVEIFAYCHSKEDKSSFRGRFLNAVEHYVPISCMSNAEVAQRIFDDGIDVLVDLQGFTQGCRLEIFAMRPAPVQATYLGFPGTTGLDCIDYIIGDPIVTPLEQAACYTEKICQLPETYQCNDNKRTTAEYVPSREEEGLPVTGTVFCCFNMSSKIDERTFRAWMGLLQRVPDSVLWILDAGAYTNKNLLDYATRCGVDPARIILARRAPHAAHAARIALADIALDTRIYNGHTTTSDALWAGVPVLTALGTHFASRVSASLLAACGLPELVCPDIESMCDRAAKLVEQPQRLAALRTKVQRNRFMSPLFDTERFTRHLEQAYALMVEKARAGQPPAAFRVPALPPRRMPFMSKLPLVTEARQTVVNLREEKIQQSDLPLVYTFGLCPICCSPVKSQQWFIECPPLAALPEDNPLHTCAKRHWEQCESCKHVFCHDYWTDEALQKLWELEGCHTRERQHAIDMVNRVMALHQGAVAVRTRAQKQRLIWMDIDPVSAWLPSCISESFMQAVVLSQNAQMVECCKQLTDSAVQGSFLNMNVEGRPDIVSFNGALERMPFPTLALDRARYLMHKHSLLVVSACSGTSYAWKQAEANATLTTWHDPQRLHLFSAAKMIDLVEKSGFELVDFTLTTHPDAGIEIYARKKS